MLCEKNTVVSSFEQAMLTEPIAPHVAQCHRMLVAFSGGADSAALLALMYDFCAERKIPLLAVHVHHGIRGAEADRDADAAASFCRCRGIDFRAVFADVPSYSEAHGIGFEEAARVLRYDALYKIADEVDGTLIATAHSADDTLETVLFRLVRGTALSGLAGIPPVRGRIIRPLLAVSAADIRAFCKEQEIAYVTDSTNDDTAYVRNFIRREIVPHLSKLTPDPALSVSRMCAAVRTDCAYLDEVAAVALGLYSAATSVPLSHVVGLHNAILSRVIAILYTNAAHTKRDLSSVHIGDVMHIVRRGGYGRISLPGGMVATVSCGNLKIAPAQAPHATDPGFVCPLAFGENRFEQYGYGIRIDRGEKNPTVEAEYKNIYKLSICRSLPFATIDGQMFVRHRRGGDMVRIGGMTRSVKKLLNAAKIPPEARATLPIVCDGRGILWIPGFAPRDSTVKTDDGETVTFTYFVL